MIYCRTAAAQNVITDSKCNKRKPGALCPRLLKISWIYYFLLSFVEEVGKSIIYIMSYIAPPVILAVNYHEVKVAL